MVILSLLTLMDNSHSVSRLRKLLYHLQENIGYRLQHVFGMIVKGMQFSFLSQKILQWSHKVLENKTRCKRDR